MTNKNFTRLLQRTGAAKIKYRQLLAAAQEEYVRRYGELPGDHYNDPWIDSLEGVCGVGDDSVDAELVDEWAVAAGRESYLSIR